MKTAMTRREMLGTIAATAPLLTAAPSLFSAESTGTKRLGVCSYSYNIHWQAARDGQRDVPFKDTLEFIDYCHQFGAGGVQIGVGSKEPGYPTKIRAKTEAFQMYFEGQVNLLKDASDADRFDADL